MIDEFTSAVKHIATSVFYKQEDQDRIRISMGSDWEKVAIGLKVHYKEITPELWSNMLKNFSDTAIVVDMHRVGKDGFIAYPSPNSFAEYAFNYIISL